MADRIFIPKFGTKLKLVVDWHCVLNWTYDNNELFQALKLPPRNQPSKGGYINGRYQGYSNGYDPEDPYDVILPAGTILTLNRINVRRTSYTDDISFTIFECPDKRLATIKKGGELDRVIKIYPPIEETSKIECEVLPK